MSHIIKTVGLLPMAAKTEATQLREKERERQRERGGGRADNDYSNTHHMEGVFKYKGASTAAVSCNGDTKTTATRRC